MSTLPVAPVGEALRKCAELGDRVRIVDMYDGHGADVYDDITRRDDHEIRELLARLDRPGDVLELAAGAGRMSLPLAAAGHRVTALDLSTRLLALLESRREVLVPAAARRLRTVHGDMSDFDLGERFDLIFLGSTSITLLTAPQRQSLYRCVRAHLRPGGRFVVTVPVLLDAPGDCTLETIGWSGTGYTMYDHSLAGQGYRTVTIIPTDPPAVGPVQVVTSRPSLFDGSIVDRELVEAGLTIDPVIALGGLAQRIDARMLIAQVTS